MKILKKTYSLAVWMLVGMLLGIVVNTTVFELYRLLGEFFPRAFPSYDIASGDKYFDSLYTSLWLVSLVITLFFTVYLSLRYNNDRLEYIISKTDGLYEIPDILKTYVSNFAVSDIISSAFIGIVFTVPMIFVPNGFIYKGSFIATLIEPYKSMIGCFGYVLGPIVAILILIVCHACAVPAALAYYRAKWLTGFAEDSI